MTTERDFEPSSVLCAIDFEAPVDAVLDTAVSVARRFGATLHLVHVWLPAVAMTPEGSMFPAQTQLDAVAAMLEEQLRAIGEAVRRNHARVRTKLVAGTPAREIVRYAEEHHCDLIVTGTHGRRGLSRLVEGSIAEHVVRNAAVPVLVVPIAHAESASAKIPRAITDEEAATG